MATFVNLMPSTIRVLRKPPTVDKGGTRKYDNCSFIVYPTMAIQYKMTDSTPVVGNFINDPDANDWIDGIHVQSVKYATPNLPRPKADVYYIVTYDIAVMNYEREDLLFPTEEIEVTDNDPNPLYETLGRLARRA